MDIMQLQRWMYENRLPPDSRQALDLLTRYSGIEPRVSEQYIRAFRERAWTLFRTPMIGRWRFLRLLELGNPHYRNALTRLHARDSDDVVLDLGCGMGQVVRQLIDGGIHPSRVYGLDNDSRMIKLGYQLFGDNSRLHRQFVVADMLSETDSVLKLGRAVSVVHATSFWHLFSWPDQVLLACRLVELVLRPVDRKQQQRRTGPAGALIFGDQVGSINPGRIPCSWSAAFLHNEASFQSLWDEVGQATGTKWHVVMQTFESAVGDQAPGVDKDIKCFHYGVYQTD